MRAMVSGNSGSSTPTSASPGCIPARVARHGRRSSSTDRGMRSPHRRCPASRSGSARLVDEIHGFASHLGPHCRAQAIRLIDDARTRSAAGEPARAALAPTCQWPPPRRTRRWEAGSRVQLQRKKLFLADARQNSLDLASNSMCHDCDPSAKPVEQLVRPWEPVVLLMHSLTMCFSRRAYAAFVTTWFPIPCASNRGMHRF